MGPAYKLNFLRWMLTNGSAVNTYLISMVSNPQSISMASQKVYLTHSAHAWWVELTLRQLQRRIHGFNKLTSCWV